MIQDALKKSWPKVPEPPEPTHIMPKGYVLKEKHRLPKSLPPAELMELQAKWVNGSEATL